LNESLACARAAGSTGIEIHALAMLANGYTEELGREQDIRLGQEAIALARAYGDRWLLGLAIGDHGIEMYRLGETQKATELMNEAYRLSHSVGDDYLTAIWANNLAWQALCAGDTVEARYRLDESLGLAQHLDAPRDIGGATVNLGWLELLEGNLDRACRCFEEGAASARRLGQRALSAEALWGHAHAAAARGDPDRAARLAGAAEAVGGHAGIDLPASITFAHHLDDARTALGEHAWQKAWADGTDLDLDAALRLAVDQ
jgi:tetratricopeptide (TPR) repeat protein